MRQNKMGDDPLPWIFYATIVLCSMHPALVRGTDSNIVNVALEKPIQVIPASATCGFGDSNEFIINTVFEFSTLAHLFRDNHVMKCASDCVRKHPRDITYLKVTEPGQVLSFGEPTCSSSSSSPSPGCYVTQTYPQSQINTYSLWLWANSTAEGYVIAFRAISLRTGFE